MDLLDKVVDRLLGRARMTLPQIVERADEREQILRGEGYRLSHGRISLGEIAKMQQARQKTSKER